MYATYVVMLHTRCLVSAGAWLDIVYFILPHVYALDTATYVVCCVLLYVCTMGTAAYTICRLLPHKFLSYALQCYCILHVLAGLCQIICCIHVTTWSLPMGSSAVHGTLCNAWYIVYCHIIHYCEYWSDTMTFVLIWCNNWCSKLLNLDQSVSIAMVLSTCRSISCQPGSKSSNF